MDDDTAWSLLDAADEDVLKFAAGQGLDGSAAYDLSKKLLVLHAKARSAALLEAGVRMNTVSPGPTETPIIGDFRTSMGPSVDGAAEIVGRLGRPEEVAAAVAFLLSPAGVLGERRRPRARRRAAGRPRRGGAHPLTRRHADKG